MHLGAELRLVDADQKADRAGPAPSGQHAARRRLGKRFHENDARQHGVAGEMTGEQRQRRIDVELGRNRDAGLARKDAAHPYERIAMRQQRLDACAAAGKRDGGFRSGFRAGLSRRGAFASLNAHRGFGGRTFRLPIRRFLSQAVLLHR